MNRCLPSSTRVHALVSGAGTDWVRPTVITGEADVASGLTLTADDWLPPPLSCFWVNKYIITVITTKYNSSFQAAKRCQTNHMTTSHYNRSRRKLQTVVCVITWHKKLRQETDCNEATDNEPLKQKKIRQFSSKFMINKWQSQEHCEWF